MTPEQLLAYMKRAYQGGYDGRNKGELIQSMIAELGPADAEDSEGDFRIYPLDELRSAPDGATFVSEPLGPFKIESYAGSKFCRFMLPNARMAVASLSCSSFPLDRGIRKVSSDEFQELLQENDPNMAATMSEYTPKYEIR